MTPKPRAENCPVCDFDTRFDDTLDTHRERSINFRVERALDLLAAETGADCAFVAFRMGTSRTMIKDEILATDPGRIPALSALLKRKSTDPAALLHTFAFGKRLSGTVGLLKPRPRPLDRALLEKAASRLDSLLFQVLVEFAHRNYITAVDSALDRFSIEQSLALALELLADYTGAEMTGVVFYETGDLAASDLKAIVRRQGESLKDDDIPQEHLRSLFRGAPSPACAGFFGLPRQFADTTLVRREGGEQVVIGRAFVARADGRFDYFEKQLLNAFGWLVDSRITNYHEMAARLREFLDPKLVRIIINHPEQYKALLQAQRHTIAMIYGDIVGFSRVTENLPVEITLELVNEFLTRMQRVVFRHGGVYDKSVGDCVIALAGPPFIDGKKEDPGRDSHAALCIAADMIREMAAISEAFEVKLGERVSLAVGVNTGEVTVGEFGPENSRGFSALGREMNLGARIQGLAGADTICCTEATRRACLAHQKKNPDAAPFKFEKRGLQSIKNMRDVMVYEVIVPPPKAERLSPPHRLPASRRRKKGGAAAPKKERAARA